MVSMCTIASPERLTWAKSAAKNKNSDVIFFAKHLQNNKKILLFAHRNDAQMVKWYTR